MADGSLFDAVRQTGGSRLVVVPLARETLTHLIHTLEDLVLERKLAALVCVGPGPARTRAAFVPRLRGLAEKSASVIVLGEEIEVLDGIEGLVAGVLDSGEALLDERFLLVLSYSFSVVLCARPRQNVIQDPAAASFDAVWSFEPDIVTASLDWLTDYLAARNLPVALETIRSIRSVLTPMTTDVGALAHFTTEMIRFEEQLHQELARVERERGRVYEREALLSTIARAFIDLPADQLDVAVDAALLAVGQFSGADSCFLVELSDDGERFEVSHQWNGEYADDLVLSLPASQERILRQTVGPLDVILIDDLERADGSDPLGSQLLAQGLRSLAAVPMVYRETLLGYVSLAAQKPRAWKEEDRYLLETLMEIVVAALEHRRVERALGETESLLQRVIYSTSHMVYVYAVLRDGTIRQMYSSSNIEHILGYPQERKLEDWDFWTSLIVSSDRPAARVQLDRLMRGVDSETEYRVIHADGRVVWVRDSARCEAGTGDVKWICYGVISDITDRRAVNQALRDRERLQMALEAERKVGEVRNRFMLVVSHEFRTPLSIILTSADMLDRYHDRMDGERRRERLSTIRSQVQHLRAMLDEISVVIRAELGRLDFRPAATDVAEFTRQIVAEIASTVGALHRIEVSIEPAELRAFVDVSLLRHVLTNLLSNAIKFSEGRAKVTLNVSVTVADGQQALCFEVLDEGIGLNRDELDRLFEPFFRGKNAYAISGTGLGLKVVRDCLLRHGGQIIAEPRLSGGSRFVASVPYHAAPPPVVNLTETAPEAVNKDPTRGE